MKLLYIFLLAIGLWAAPGDIVATRIVGVTTLVVDATSACNTSSACNGWVLEVDIESANVGGTYSLGIGTRNNTNTATGYCDITGSGYDAAANLITTTRRVYATKPLRKAYNAAYVAPYPADEIVVSGILTVRLSLSEYAYQSETVNCTIAAGLYTQGSVTSGAFSGSTTNASTLTYAEVKPVANWAWPGWTRVNASLAGDGTNNADGSVTVRAVAYHRHATNAKPVAAVVFSLTNGAITRTTIATTMTSNATLGDAVRVIEYVGTFSSADIQAFPNGTAATLHFVAYPWIGDATAVLNTATTGFVQPTPVPAERTLLIDYAGTYGTAAAVVDSATGNDTTCQIVAESAFNPNSPPSPPCATINGAAFKMRGFNNTTYGRGDAAGVIYLQAGNHNWTGSNNVITGVANTWTVIRPFPNVPKSAVIINGMSGNPHLGTGTKIKLQGLTLNISSGPAVVFSSSTQYLWADDCDMTSNATSATIQATSFFVTRSTIRNCTNCLQSLSTAFIALARGNSVTSAYLNGASMWTVIGNEIEGNTTFQFVSALNNTLPSPSTWWPIIAYNRVLSLRITTGSPFSYVTTQGTQPVGSGLALVQNVFEYLPSVSTALVRIAADASTVTPIKNIMLWYNTLVGQRVNRGYNDNGTTIRYRQLWSEIGNLYDSAANKSDTFSPASAQRVGNWPLIYGVGYYGNMNVEAGTPSNPVGLTAIFQLEFPGIYSDYIPISATNNTQATIQPPANSAGMRPVNYQQFVSRRAWDGITPGAGNGDYRLLSGSPAISLIPAGGAVLPADIEGYPRRNDGVGAAGAYEIRTLARPSTRIIR